MQPERQSLVVSNVNEADDLGILNPGTIVRMGFEITSFYQVAYILNRVLENLRDIGKAQDRLIIHDDTLSLGFPFRARKRQLGITPAAHIRLS